MELTVAALVELLQDASTPVKAAAARALGALKKAAAPAVPALVPLLQDRDESVRTAAAETIAQVGPLDQAATETLVEGLASPDNVVRAQTAQALGTIGAAAEEAAPALVEAMADDNDRVRAEGRGGTGQDRRARGRGRRSRPGAGAAGSRQLGSVPWRPKPWDRWGSRPTRPSPPWSIPWAISTRRCAATPPRRWAIWARPRPCRAIGDRRSGSRRGRRCPQPGHPRPGRDWPPNAGLGAGCPDGVARTPTRWCGPPP